MLIKNKYHNKKTEVNGIIFDSKKEARRYQELIMLAKAGQIFHLRVQPHFLLQEAFTHEHSGRIRKIEYIADFMYWDDNLRRMIVEDVKGVKTDVYKLKKKLFLAKYSEYELREI